MSKLSRHQIARVFAQRSLGSTVEPDLAQEIAAYLLTERRISQLDSILRDMLEYRAQQGVVEVLASSAHKLTEAVRKDIEARMYKLYPAAKRVIISEQLDNDLVGNIRLELAHQQFDATVRTKLNHFKQLTAAGKDN